MTRVVAGAKTIKGYGDNFTEGGAKYRLVDGLMVGQGANVSWLTYYDLAEARPVSRRWQRASEQLLDWMAGVEEVSASDA